MKAVAFLRAVGAELVSLIVEDWVTFVGGILALLLMYLFGHDVHALHAVGGFVAFALVWAALAVSFVRAARSARPVEEPTSGLRPFAHGEVERS